VAKVNFWRPSSTATFKALQWGEPFLFKLHSPRNFIVGGGFFTKFLQLPVSLAWEAFGEANGATSLEQVRLRIAKYRKHSIGPTEDPQIGCILLEEPFFFEESDWIPVPDDFKQGIQMGKGYEMESGTGVSLWQDVRERLDRTKVKNIGPATIAAQERGRYGEPVLVSPRLGQGSFRLLVTDAYGYRCAMTSERTLPVLEAAHIRPYSEGGEHALSNGLLLRSDLHTLFDMGYVSVDPKTRPFWLVTESKRNLRMVASITNCAIKDWFCPRTHWQSRQSTASPITPSTSLGDDSYAKHETQSESGEASPLLSPETPQAQRSPFRSAVFQ
jgi:putative restriction endonuclease